MEPEESTLLDQTVTLLVDQETKRRMKEEARARRVSMSTIVRWALDEYFREKDSRRELALAVGR